MKMVRGNRNRKFNYNYNCYGYAIGSFKWESMWDIYNKDYSMSLTKCIDSIITSFPQLVQVPPRVVLNNQSDRDEYYAIAFRVGNADKHWNDYHFMKQWKNGNWYQKCGSTEGIYKHEGNILDPWTRPDGFTYNGKIVFFLMPRAKAQ